MASPPFGSKATAGGATAANVTCNVPASTADNDLLLFFLSKDATDAVTWPGGWNILAEGTANTFYMGIGWRRASSEPANYTWNFASTWRDCVMLRYTGVVTGENPNDPDTPPAMVEAASVTSLASNNDVTTTADTTGVAFANQKAIISWAAAPGSWVARQNAAGNECYVIDLVVASGTITDPTMSTAGGTPSGPMKAYIVAIQSVSAGGAQDTPELRGRPAGLRGERQMHQLLAQ